MHESQIVDGDEEKIFRKIYKIHGGCMARQGTPRQPTRQRVAGQQASREAAAAAGCRARGRTGPSEPVLATAQAEGALRPKEVGRSVIYL